jgi:hypothetical protein
LNDLHSTEGRHNSSEIIDLETKIKNNKTKEDIHYVDIKQKIEEANEEKNKEINELRSVLSQNNEKNIYTRSKFREIEKKYKSWIQPIDITTWNNSITKQIEATNTEKYIDINNENVRKNLNSIQKISKQLAENNRETIYLIVWTDWSIHLINDIDTGHYIISKNILENWDIVSFIEDVWGKKSRWTEKMENLDNIEDVLMYQKKTGKDKILQVRDNIPLEKEKNEKEKIITE